MGTAVLGVEVNFIPPNKGRKKKPLLYSVLFQRNDVRLTLKSVTFIKALLDTESAKFWQQFLRPFRNHVKLEVENNV